jgi:hypothetical protein
MVSNDPPPPNEGAPAEIKLEEEIKACLSRICSLVGTVIVKGRIDLIICEKDKIKMKNVSREKTFTYQH